MKAIHFFPAVILAGTLAFVKLGHDVEIKNTKASDYDKPQVRDKIVTLPVYATINYNGVLYSDTELKTPVDYLAAGDRVEILKDKTRKVYYIKHNSRLGWVDANILNIPPDEPTLKNNLTKEEIESYAQKMRFKSETDYFVWVDIARQRVYVLKYDDKGVLRLEKNFICATGMNKSPTTRGYFTISDRGDSFYNPRLKSGARYWVRFNGSYLFHSIALNEDGSVKDGTLGVRRSDGCVRMSMDDIKWFYEAVPEGTGVRVN